MASVFWKCGVYVLHIHCMSHIACVSYMIAWQWLVRVTLKRAQHSLVAFPLIRRYCVYPVNVFVSSGNDSDSPNRKDEWLMVAILRISHSIVGRGILNKYFKKFLN